MDSNTKSLTHCLNLTSNVNWRVNIFGVYVYECVLFVCWERKCDWVVGDGFSSCRVCPCCNASVLHWKRCAKGANLLSHFSSSSYQVITISPMKYQHGAGTLVMVENRHRSSCNYDSFLLSLLSLHNQLHQGWNNWFSIYANGMDLERRGANTQPCCLSGVTFKMEWRKCWIQVR